MLRRGVPSLALAVLLLAVVVLPAGAQVSLPSGPQAPSSAPTFTAAQRAVLNKFAADTWQSFVAMIDSTSGLPADSVGGDGVRAAYTSPTDIGVYIWSTLAARDLKIIQPPEARDRLTRTLDTLAQMERHTLSGMFYNWYDRATGAKLTVWPANGSHIYPFLSTVDNAWLAAALMMVANSAEPPLRDRAQAILSNMNFGCFLNPANGLLKGGFWLVNDQPGGTVLGDFCNAGTQVAYTGYDNGTLNTETRIASYVAIALGQVPPSHYFRMFRTFPNTCDWSWQEMAPVGVTRTYDGVDVYEAHYTYAGLNIVPSWGGSMFEALMVPLLVPEEEWGPQSWGINHPLYVKAQVYHGLDEAKYGYWGFSPSEDTLGGYGAFGVDAIGLNPTGYASDLESTLVDYGFRDPSGTGYCPGRDPQPLPNSYGRGIVAPYASFLALRYAPDAALSNLAKLALGSGVYGWGGFFDAVSVQQGAVTAVASTYLAVDQGMIMAALDNVLVNDRLRHYFSYGAVEQSVKPLLKMEQFTAGS